MGDFHRFEEAHEKEFSRILQYVWRSDQHKAQTPTQRNVAMVMMSKIKEGKVITMTQEYIADELCITPKHVSRAMRGLYDHPAKNHYGKNTKSESTAIFELLNLGGKRGHEGTASQYRLKDMSELTYIKQEIYIRSKKPYSQSTKIDRVEVDKNDSQSTNLKGLRSSKMHNNNENPSPPVDPLLSHQYIPPQSITTEGHKDTRGDILSIEEGSYSNNNSLSSLDNKRYHFALEYFASQLELLRIDTSNHDDVLAYASQDLQFEKEFALAKR